MVIDGWEEGGGMCNVAADEHLVIKPAAVSIVYLFIRTLVANFLICGLSLGRAMEKCVRVCLDWSCNN